MSRMEEFCVCLKDSWLLEVLGASGVALLKLLECCFTFWTDEGKGVE